MNNQTKSSFIQGVKREWSKISWTPKKQLSAQCAVVIVASAAVVLLITIIDTGALALIERIVG